MTTIVATLALIATLSSRPDAAGRLPVMGQEKPPAAQPAGERDADAVRHRVKEGQRVRITDDHRREWQGRIEALATTASRPATPAPSAATAGYSWLACRSGQRLRGSTSTTSPHATASGWVSAGTGPRSISSTCVFRSTSFTTGNGDRCTRLAGPDSVSTSCRTNSGTARLLGTKLGGTLFGGIELYAKPRTPSFKIEARYHAVRNNTIGNADGLAISLGFKKYF